MASKALQRAAFLAVLCVFLSGCSVWQRYYPEVNIIVRNFANERQMRRFAGEIMVTSVGYDWRHVIIGESRSLKSAEIVMMTLGETGRRSRQIGIELFADNSVQLVLWRAGEEGIVEEGRWLRALVRSIAPDGVEIFDIIAQTALPRDPTIELPPRPHWPACRSDTYRPQC